MKRRTNSVTPFSGNQGTQILSKMRKELKNCLPDNVKTTITYEGNI